MSTPEHRARQDIDHLLAAAGRAVQDFKAPPDAISQRIAPGLAEGSTSL